MIFITGASSGIGLECAKIFAENGHDLLLCARRTDRLDALKKSLPTKVECIELDVSDKRAVEIFAKENSDLLSRVTVLVNNAGLAKGMGPIQEGQTDDWDVMIDTNVKGLLYLTHAMLPHFLKKNSGHIINMGSVASRWAYPKGNIYSATKRAVSALTESLRIDLSGKNIRVTEICPGMVETEFSIVRLGDTEKAKAIYAGMDPLNARDIAECVYWAFSRPARVNIQEIVIYPTMQASPSLVHRR